MLKVSQVASRLNLSVSKTYELIENGELGHHRLGGAIRVSERQLAEFLAATCVEVQGRRTKTARRPRLRHIEL